MAIDEDRSFAKKACTKAREEERNEAEGGHY